MPTMGDLNVTEALGRHQNNNTVGLTVKCTCVDRCHIVTELICLHVKVLLQLLDAV